MLAKSVSLASLPMHLHMLLHDHLHMLVHELLHPLPEFALQMEKIHFWLLD